MKLLFDEQLSPKLVRRLADLFPGSAHVHECGLGAADDTEIWHCAARGGFVIVSKDVDFFRPDHPARRPAEAALVAPGEFCSTAVIASLLRAFAEQVQHFGADRDDALLILP